jgi:hypothetical protein
LKVVIKLLETDGKMEIYFQNEHVEPAGSESENWFQAHLTLGIRQESLDRWEEMITRTKRVCSKAANPSEYGEQRGVAVLAAQDAVE